ncbi:hypothetical protein CFHF_05610 [Caulobacter flavus]|uniref:Uncharacterized protein n=1 Tax=Caulobacter flavus TaxID=1679497 RepID=A0A2N5CWP2_9CAUL|nr:hypothetical protein C1707_14615 [Caulobacter flavus]PLR18237.1 hypothetical protein CFHF_05610 [Caulobacter flavus]
MRERLRGRQTALFRHPGRSAAKSRDPGAGALRSLLGPGSAALRASARDDEGWGVAFKKPRPQACRRTRFPSQTQGPLIGAPPCPVPVRAT